MYLNRQNITVWGTDALKVEHLEVNKNIFNPLVASSQETQPTPTITEPLKKEPNIINGKDITFLLFLPLLFLTVGFIFKIGFRKINKNQLQLVKYNSKIACRQCQFFNNNYYLKCAVHPDKVLKNEAKDCLDYQEKSDIKNDN